MDKLINDVILSIYQYLDIGSLSKACMLNQKMKTLFSKREFWDKYYIFNKVYRNEIECDNPYDWIRFFIINDKMRVYMEYLRYDIGECIDIPRNYSCINFYIDDNDTNEKICNFFKKPNTIDIRLIQRKTNVIVFFVKKYLLGISEELIVTLSDKQYHDFVYTIITTRLYETRFDIYLIPNVIITSGDDWIRHLFVCKMAIGSLCEIAREIEYKYSSTFYLLYDNDHTIFYINDPTVDNITRKFLDDISYYGHLPIKITFGPDYIIYTWNMITYKVNIDLVTRSKIVYNAHLKQIVTNVYDLNGDKCDIDFDGVVDGHTVDSVNLLH